ncbi:MAG: hypothetical protein H0U70_04370 [Tatlockia sp.]|nr:hypothetical protein [Tatlockia sp.]
MAGGNLPKISGLLNNCALNCALPTLLKTIDILAELEQKGSITPYPIIDSYTLLKENFAEYYGITEVEKFDFREFSKFLIPFSFHAKEIIFAPVLRKIISYTATKSPKAEAEFSMQIIDENDLFMQKDIGVTLSQLHEDGRYPELSIEEANVYLYKDFGISANLYIYQSNKKTENHHDNYEKAKYWEVAAVENYPFGEPPQIALYHRGDHYELVPHEDVASEDKLEDEKILSDTLSAAYEILTSGEDKELSAGVLDNLQNIIKLQLYEQLGILIEAPEQAWDSKESSKESYCDYSDHKYGFFCEKNDSAMANKANLNLGEIIPLTLEPIYDLSAVIEDYFGEEGFLKTYLKERALTFKWQDEISQFFANCLGCFYQTEAEERESYINQLDLQIRSYAKTGDKKSLVELITYGKQEFSSRAELGEKDYRKSLKAKLGNLENAIKRVENIQNYQANSRSSVFANL